MYSGPLIAALAGAVALTAAISDVRQRRIPNALTYSSALAGIAVQTAAYGWRGLVSSVAGGVCFGGLLLVFYLIRAMGAGDVKLAAALGCIVGLGASVQVMLATAISGGIFAIVFMVWSRNTGEILRSTVSVLGFHARHGFKAHPVINLDNPKTVRMPYGIAFAAGTLYWTIGSLWR
ncbi:MAG: A24 family peptidase [Terriglobales bacterium]